MAKTENPPPERSAFLKGDVLNFRYSISNNNYKPSNPKTPALTGDKTVQGVIR